MPAAPYGHLAGVTVNNDQSYTASYNSYSGVDIRATFGGIEFGTLQGISFTVTREKAPNYFMGRANPFSFSRGKRGIAGSMIIGMLDRDALLHTMILGGKGGFAGWDEEIGAFVRHLIPTASLGSLVGVDPLGSLEQLRLRRRMPVSYADQILPFDVVLVAANEYGSVSKCVIHGIEFLNMGSGVSIDDITTDANYTFVCTDITPWHRIHTEPLDELAQLPVSNVGRETPPS